VLLAVLFFLVAHGVLCVRAKGVNPSKKNQIMMTAASQQHGKGCLTIFLFIPLLTVVSSLSITQRGENSKPNLKSCHQQQVFVRNNQPCAFLPQ